MKRKSEAFFIGKIPHHIEHSLPDMALGLHLVNGTPGWLDQCCGTTRAEASPVIQTVFDQSRGIKSLQSTNPARLRLAACHNVRRRIEDDSPILRDVLSQGRLRFFQNPEDLLLFQKNTHDGQPTP
jgi:hypothetical protein